MSYGKCRPFCLGLNVLRYLYTDQWTWLESDQGPVTMCDKTKCSNVLQEESKSKNISFIVGTLQNK